MAELSEPEGSASLTLTPRLSGGGQVQLVSQDHWRLRIPAGPSGGYRLAQLDDYSKLRRGSFPWTPPLTLSLQVRASTRVTIPGTWGFGLWNDPFSLSLGFGGGARRFPALPNAAWFFFASPPNHLSLFDELPGEGSLAASFRSAGIPSPLLSPGALLLPMLALPPLARGLRRLARRMISQAAAHLDIDPSTWHGYRIEWLTDRVKYWVDETLILQTNVSPCSPLGLVFWIDNQYAAFPPNGRLRYGTLANPNPAWLEIRCLTIT